jgi:hypothetical protein
MQPRYAYLLLLLLIIVNLIAGAFLVADYGESWDEAYNKVYAVQSLQAYAWWFDRSLDLEEHLGPTNQRYRGPAYPMLATLLINALRRVHHGWKAYDLWHYASFLTFQIGLLFFFALCRRLAGAWASFGATLLFAFQPLLWGHAFINSKDIPFMVFFMGSLAGGLRLVDAFLSAPRPKLWFAVWLALASALLGMATSTRVLGALAGLLVAGYALLKAGRRALPLLLAYAGLSAAIAFLTWPYLWTDPAGNLLRSLQASTEFEWIGLVLFRGVYYIPEELPPGYLPILFALQFTEPALLLCLGGAVLAFARLRQRLPGWEEHVWVAAWFLIPLLLAVALRPIIYDNFRHFLFSIPPIFILAGLGLDWLLSRIRSKVVGAIVLVALALPGLYQGIALHPYEYIYYNSLAGGVRGAFRKFELDYWLTSYREATLYLNREAPQNAKVYVAGPRRIFARYAREDLNSRWFFQEEEALAFTDPVYAVITTRFNEDQTRFPDAPVIHTVSRAGVDLAVIKKVK